MKPSFHELTDRQRSQLQYSLALPVGEFAALIIGALLTLAFFLGPPEFATDAKDIVRAAAANVSGAVSHLGDRQEARAAEHNPPPARP
jgi:hypothetical protein